MRHIRYLYSNATVCHEPERLGSEFVKVDFAGEGDPCRECSILVAADNAKAFAEETNHPGLVRDLDDYNYGLPRGPMEGASGGFGAGAFVASLLWLAAVLFVLILAVKA